MNAKDKLALENAMAQIEILHRQVIEQAKTIGKLEHQTVLDAVTIRDHEAHIARLRNIFAQRAARTPRIRAGMTFAEAMAESKRTGRTAQSIMDESMRKAMASAKAATEAVTATTN